MNNPVIYDFRGNFRELKVFWHEKTDRRIMAVTLPTFYQVRFYSSANLID